MRKTIMAPPTYSTEKPKTIHLDKVYVHVGHEKIYFGRGGELCPGGLVRVPVQSFGPQRDPTESSRLAWVKRQVADFKPHLYRDPSHVNLDENGEYNDIDGGGRALMAHILGHPTIEAFVSEGLSDAEVATQFGEHAGGRIGLGAVQIFLKYVAQGSPRHVAILRSIQPYFTVRKGGIGAINSVGALYGIYDFAKGAPEDLNGDNYAGARLLKRTAEECHLAWNPIYETDDKGKRALTRKGHTVDGNLFVAVALVLQAMPLDCDLNKFRRWLAGHSPKVISDVAQDEITAVAMRSAKYSLTSANKTLSLDRAIPMARVITMGYNKGLKTGMLRISMEGIADSNLGIRYAKGRQSRHEV